VCVFVNFLEAGLMHMSMGVLGPVVVGVSVFVLDVLVFVRGVRVCVGGIAMLMFVRMRPFMGVLFSHSDHLLRSKPIVLLIAIGRRLGALPFLRGSFGIYARRLLGNYP
jgi:hypothetical protein